MPFAQKKQITDRISSFVRSFSTVAIVHLMLSMRALSVLVNNLATW
jgi:hypothetical protein